MGNVNLLSSKDNKLLRNPVISPKIRNSPKLLGFSASVALVGFGIQAWKSNFNEAQKDYSKRGLLNRRLHLEPFNIRNASESVPLIGKKCRETVFSSFFNSIKPFTLLTPVACEDVICDCSVENKSADGGIIGSKLVHKCNCKACVGDSCTESTKYVGFESNESTNKNADTKAVEESPPKKQEKDEKPGSCGKPKKGPRKSCSGGTPTSVSNKPCRSSSNACAQVTDFDIEALSEQLGGLKQVDFYVDSDLSHCFLIKQASQITVDSVTRIITETASAYDDYHVEYRRVIDMMMDTLEDSRKACGAELEMIECKIVLIRAKVDEMKRRITELDMFLGSLEKLGNAAAETAFMANAEYASVAVSERLQSLCLEVKRIREQTKEKERDMLDLQALIIVETGKSLK